MSKKNNKPLKAEKVESKFYNKLELEKGQKIWYIIIPIILSVITLVFSILDFEVQVIHRQPTNKTEFKYYAGTTEVFHSDRYIEDSLVATSPSVSTSSTPDDAALVGDPNVIGIIGSITLILCMIFIPKSMLKKREHGDGLGLMFLPLALMCVNNIMCTLLYTKDLVAGISFSLVCFVVGALATFKNTIKHVEKLCFALIVVAAFLFLADLTPYCYNESYALSIVDGEIVQSPLKQYYISYFIRDILTFISFGIFSSYIAKTYKYNGE